eukprot:1162100-Pelagomonas_calceolata.AAC.6
MCARVWAAGAVEANVLQSIQTSRIVTMYDVLLHGEVRRAVCELASHLWVPGRADGGGNQRGADWYPYCLDWGTGRGVLGVVGGSGWPASRRSISIASEERERPCPGQPLKRGTLTRNDSDEQLRWCGCCCTRCTLNPARSGCLLQTHLHRHLSCTDWMHECWDALA